MRISPAALVACLWLLSGPVVRGADVFEKHTAQHLQQAADRNEPVKRLSLEEARRLKSLSATISTPALVVRTNDGNWTKALVAWGFRPGDDGERVPVLLIERFVTYRRDRTDLTTAADQGVMLFAGFTFNFDIGQVVPEGQGGDIRFTKDGTIEPVADAEMYGLDGSRLRSSETDDLADEGNRDADDFTGTWKVSVDGRWDGEWELTAHENGRITGTYTSAETKSRYDITGRVARLPRHLRLTVHLANAQQNIDAWLWSEDPSRMTGTATLAGQKFGFLAKRPAAAKTDPKQPSNDASTQPR